MLRLVVVCVFALQCGVYAFQGSLPSTLGRSHAVLGQSSIKVCARGLRSGNSVLGVRMAEVSTLRGSGRNDLHYDSCVATVSVRYCVCVG